MTIRVDATNLAAKTYVGMDNVAFDQQPNWTAFQGQVINDKNANGIQDGGEAGLAGIEMFLDTNNNGVLDPDEVHTLTDFAGQYNFGMVTPGQYHVREVLPAGTRLSKTAGNGFAILGQPGIYNFVRFYDTQKAEIQVNFFEDRNDDGIRQANEIPPLYAAPPETLQLYKQFQRGVIATAQCDTAGNLTFDNLAPGTYVLKDVSPDYLTTARTVTVTVGSGGIGTASSEKASRCDGCSAIGVRWRICHAVSEALAPSPRLLRKISGCAAPRALCKRRRPHFTNLDALGVDPEWRGGRHLPAACDLA